MSNFNRFQEKNKIRANSINGGNSLFIDNGYNSRIITNLKSNIKLHAAIVNEQEKDFISYLIDECDMLSEKDIETYKYYLK